jgi:hypothetical protein
MSPSLVCNLALTGLSGDHPGSELWQGFPQCSVLNGTECLINDDHACVGWGGGEVWVRPFQVLAYCSESRR